MDLNPNPFLNKEGIIDFPYQPLRDILFVWPDELPERIGSIIIPEYVRQDHRSSAGIVLAAGPGCYVKKRKKFIPVTVRVGEYVIFDAGLPWSMKIKAPDGEMYEVKYMAECDINGIVREGS